MRYALAPAALILALNAAGVRAQGADHDPYSGAPLPPRRHEAPGPVTDHFYIRGTWYVPQVRTNMRIDPSNPGAVGTWANAENDLGLTRRLHRGRVEFMFRLRERGKVRVNYFESDRAGEKVLAHDIVFGNETFAAGQLTRSSLDWRQFDITYTYSVLHTPYLEIGPGFAVYFLQVDAIGEVPAQNRRQEETAATPLPALALDFAWRISGRWAVTARGGYLKATLNGFHGWYADLNEDLQYRWNRNFALGLGYASIRTALLRRGGSFPGAFDMSTSGPQAFVRFSY